MDENNIVSSSIGDESIGVSHHHHQIDVQNDSSLLRNNSDPDVESLDNLNDRLSQLNRNASKHRESIENDERDSYSPIEDIETEENINFGESNLVNLHISVPYTNGSQNNVDVEDDKYRKNRSNSCTKEEKQRQNEEIVTLETSSVSSETGSWESVFPHQRRNMDLKDLCTNFILNEKNPGLAGQVMPIETESLKIFKNENVPKLRSPDVVCVNSIASTSGACFIDASTLLDESEITFPTLEGPKLPSEGCFGPMPTDENSLKNSNIDSHEPDTESKEVNDRNASNKLIKHEHGNDQCVNSTLINSFPYESERDKGARLFPNNIHNQFETVMNTKVSSENCNYYSTHPANPLRITETTANDYDGQNRYSSDTSDYGTDSRRYSRPESIAQPDTPHNSISHMNMTNEDENIVNSGYSSLDLMESDVESNGVRSIKNRYNETTPILSGGSSIKDYTDGRSTYTQGQLNKSSGYTEGGQRRGIVEKPVTSWIVDMRTSSGRSTEDRSGSSLSNSTNDSYSRSIDNSKLDRVSASPGALGYFVSLDDLKPISEPRETTYVSRSTKQHSTSYKESLPKSTGFFIDMSDSEVSSVDVERNSSSQKSTEHEVKQKNIFSMFIDIGSSNNGRKKSLGKINNRSNGTPPVLSTEVEYVPVITRNNPSVASGDKSNRHSWSNPEDQVASKKMTLSDYKRSTSLSMDPNNAMDESNLTKQTSNISVISTISTASRSQINTISSSASDLSDANIPKTGIRKKRKDAKLNETFDKSSQGSVTDGILSKDSSTSSVTDTDDVTFQNETIETFKQMETIIESKEQKSPKLNNKQSTQPEADTKEVKESVSTDCNWKPYSMETLQATAERQKKLLETVNEIPDTNAEYVKLSDLDKPVSYRDIRPLDSYLSKSTNNTRRSRYNTHVETNSVNKPWTYNMSRSTGSNLSNLATSVENMRSLSRIFPHLSKEFSNSMPMNFELVDDNEFGDMFQSDFSRTSSIASSFSRSGMESVDESSLSFRRQLGEDLLKLFLQEIATDVIIDVNGRRIRAHKCILRSRCQYFAAILAGGWVESAGNVISLPDYSYASVHFALCHIYSGASHPPEGISLMELAGLADLLGLEGLKEVTAYSLKTNYCHNFHKPCPGCIDGIIKVITVSLTHGLDDLYRKCLKWICKHYVKVWPTRAFAELSTDLMARCRQQLIAHMTSENVLSIILDCDHITTIIGKNRWAMEIDGIVRDIIAEANDYIADHMSTLLASDGFLSLGHDQNDSIIQLEDLLLDIASNLTADQACKSYQRIVKLNSMMGAKVIRMPPSWHTRGESDECLIEHEREGLDWNNDFIRLVGSLLSVIEQCLIRNCSRAMRTMAWQRMDEELRKKIQKLARLSDPIDIRRKQPISTVHNSSRTHDLYQVKLAIEAHTRRVLAQDTNLYKESKYSHDRSNNIQDKKPKTIGVQRNYSVTKCTSKATVPEYKKSIHQSSKPISMAKPTTANKPVNNRLSEIRPRYLEPKRNWGNGPLKSKSAASVFPRNVDRQMSASEHSSRTSSPASNRRDGHRDSNTMSLDSLASPAKKKIVRKIENCDIKPAKSEPSIDSLGNSTIRSIHDIQTNVSGSAKVEKMLNQKNNINKINTNTRVSTTNTINSQQRKFQPIANTKVRTLGANSTSGSSISSLQTANTNASSQDSRDKGMIAPKSFLSARSREILAKRSSSAKSIPNVLNGINKSSTTSNIPLRNTSQSKMIKPRNEAIRHSLTTPTKSSAMKMVQPKVNVTTKSNALSKTVKDASTVKVKIIIKDKNKKYEECDSVRIDSKLERSSTFSKDCPDLPVSNLQIIE